MQRTCTIADRRESCLHDRRQQGLPKPPDQDTARGQQEHGYRQSEARGPEFGRSAGDGVRDGPRCTSRLLNLAMSMGIRRERNHTQIPRLNTEYRATTAATAGGHGNRSARPRRIHRPTALATTPGCADRLVTPRASATSQ